MNPLLLIPSAYRLIASIALVVAIIASVYAYAYRSGLSRANDACSADKLQSVQRAIEQTEAIARQDNEIVSGNLIAAQKTRTITRTILREARQNAKINPIDCRIDAGRMRLIQSAINNQIPPDPGQPDYSLSAAPLSGQ